MPSRRTRTSSRSEPTDPGDEGLSGSVLTELGQLTRSAVEMMRKLVSPLGCTPLSSPYPRVFALLSRPPISLLVGLQLEIEPDALSSRAALRRPVAVKPAAGLSSTCYCNDRLTLSPHPVHLAQSQSDWDIVNDRLPLVTDASPTRREREVMAFRKNHRGKCVTGSNSADIGAPPVLERPSKVRHRLVSMA